MQENRITILRVTYLDGPNIWTYRPVIEAWLDIGGLEELPSNLIPGLLERLSSFLPGLNEHQCSVGSHGGFLQRLRSGTYAGHILEHVVIELQTMAGMPIGFGQTREVSDGAGIYKMAFRTRDEEVGRVALACGRDLLMAAIEGRSYDVAAAVSVLRQIVESSKVMVEREVVTRTTRIIGLAGGIEASAVARLVNSFLMWEGYVVASLSSDGASLQGMQMSMLGQSHRDVGRGLLNRPDVDVAVVTTSAKDILQFGLLFNRCSVGLVTGVHDFNGMDEYFVDRFWKLFNVLRTQIDVVEEQGEAVLNADDEYSLDMARLSDGKVVLYAVSDNNPAMKEHCTRNGKGVYTAGADIVLVEQQREVLRQSMSADILKDRPSELIAAVATVWSFGLGPDQVGNVLRRYGEPICEF